MRKSRLFDLLVIGGGATGCGVALDAAARGLSVALVEKNDFAEGTSGRSTKMVHGGVRYLEMAVKKLDRSQYHLVRDALHERSILLRNAPHLTNRLPLVTPLYRWLNVPYMFSGLKLYDLLAGHLNIGHSRLLSRRQALLRFPALKAEGLKAGVLYYDGQFHDARMALALALTAEQHGAAIINHVAVSDLLKTEGKVCGAVLCDSLTHESWTIRATGVINATGPFTDRVRRLDNPAAPDILSVSSGIHIVLDGRFAPPDTGLLIPETEDGRVLFVLPWEGHALVGTTDEPADVSEHPRPAEAEIDYLLRHLSRYFNLQVGKHEIKAVWSGLRPLVSDPGATDTAGLARDHVLEESDAGLLSITGGKWTTYRIMARDTVDHAQTVFGLPAAPCRTEQLPLFGGADFRINGDSVLADEFKLPADIARYLHRTYGDRAAEVARLAAAGYDSRLAEGHPLPEATVLHAARHELAERVVDILARRTPLALLDTAAAGEALPRVLDLMASERGWSRERRDEERCLTEQRLGEAL